MRSFLIIFGASFLTTAASFFLKKSTTGANNLIGILLSKFLYLGVFLYIVQACLSFVVLQLGELPYSVIIPLGALTYVWTMLVSKKFLNEQITRRKTIAMCFILCGIIIVSI